ncbi:MAG: transposase [Peptococcaceae bacterium]|nr:transposase [Peptococcaceae bacterium]
MTHYTTMSSNLKRGILRFTEAISAGLSRPEFKFVSQMVYGLLCSQSCHISKIARALDEDILLKKTIERLCRNLATFTGGARVLKNYIKRIKHSLNDKALLIIDDGDISKPCSKKMEGLRIVHDGSTGTNRPGYHMLDITALTSEHKAPIGVYSRVYSAGEETFVSATDETLKALGFLRKHFKRGNVRVFDRGFDANMFFEDLIDHNEKFVIRVNLNRNVIYKGETVKITELAERYKGKYSLRFKRKNRKPADCKISIVPIRMCFRPGVDLNLVICRGIGQEPMLLVTNLKSEDERIAVIVTKVYLLRWRIEEFHGFKKQQFGFEDFRVRSLAAIRNLDLLLTIAIGYIGMMSERAEDKRIVMELIEISKRIYGVPRFRFYAVADGMFSVFARSKQGISHMMAKKRRSGQMSLFPEQFLSTA